MYFMNSMYFMNFHELYILYDLYVYVLHDPGIEEDLESLKPMSITRILTKGRLLETSGGKETCASGNILRERLPTGPF